MKIPGNLCTTPPPACIIDLMITTERNTEYCYLCGEYKPADTVTVDHYEDDETGWVGDEFTVCADCLDVDPADL